VAKKRRKDKELARLRREVEALRAQLAAQKPKDGARLRPTRTAEPNSTASSKEAEALGHGRKRKKQLTEVQRVNPKFLKADLTKSGVLTLIAFGILIVLNQLL